MQQHRPDRGKSNVFVSARNIQNGLAAGSLVTINPQITNAVSLTRQACPISAPFIQSTRPAPRNICCRHRSTSAANTLTPDYLTSQLSAGAGDTGGVAVPDPFVEEAAAAGWPSPRPVGTSFSMMSRTTRQPSVRRCMTTPSPLPAPTARRRSAPRLNCFPRRTGALVTEQVDAATYWSQRCICRRRMKSRFPRRARSSPATIFFSKPRTPLPTPAPSAPAGRFWSVPRMS